MKKQKGITLISLVVTIIILSILASIATYSGVSVIKSSKLTIFTTELKIMQAQVNEIYQDRDPSKVYGEEITGEIKARADSIFTASESGVTSQEGYRYWSRGTIKSLGIEGVEQDFFVNLEKRSVVSYEGLSYEGNTYYTLQQVPGGMYNVEYEEPSAPPPTFDVNVEKTGSSQWKITISNIQYEGNISKWQIQYQLEGNDTWNTTQDLSFVVTEVGNYHIQIMNGSVVSQEQVIPVET